MNLTEEYGGSVDAADHAEALDTLKAYEDAGYMARISKLSDINAKLVIACRVAMVRMKMGGFEDGIAKHVLAAAIKQAEPEEL